MFLTVADDRSPEAQNRNVQAQVDTVKKGVRPSLVRAAASSTGVSRVLGSRGSNDGRGGVAQCCLSAWMLDPVCNPMPVVGFSYNPFWMRNKGPGQYIIIE